MPNTEETKAKLSATRKQMGTRPPLTGGWNKGMKMSIAFCEKNRVGHIGIPWSFARWAAQENRNIIVEVN